MQLPARSKLQSVGEINVQAQMSGNPENDESTSPGDRCAFYLERKKRFCRVRPNADDKYCAEHAGLLGIDQGKKRIVCPLNPKHTCFEDKLEKHLKKCRNQQKDLPPYHVPGINSGDSDEDVTPKISWEEITSDELKQIIDRINSLYTEHIGTIEQEIFHHSCLDEELSNETYGIPAIRQRKQQASLIGHLQQRGLLHPGLCYVELGAGKGNFSHWIQRALQEETDVAFVLIDRGTVRYKADNQHKWEDSGPKFERLRIDIENLHLGKVDCIADGGRPIVALGKHLCGAATDLALRCVIKTVVGKSVCTKLTEEPCTKKQKVDSKSGCTSIAGVAIALCCHHRCTWKAYVGKNFMSQCGFSPRQFQILCKLSGWTSATWVGWRTRAEMEDELNSDKSMQTLHETSAEERDVGNDNSSKTDMIYSNTRTERSRVITEREKNRARKREDDSPEDFEDREDINEHKVEIPTARADFNLSPQEREEIGRRSKRLIDYGRLLFLREHGLFCDLKEYIEKKLTPENVAIFAKPDSR